LGAFTFNLRFPGQYFDKETNLHYNTYRDYSPDTGRYIESDPLGVLVTNGPTSMTGLNNLYQYVSGNPLSFSDPTGTIPAPSGAANPQRFDPRTMATSAQSSESGDSPGASPSNTSGQFCVAQMDRMTRCLIAQNACVGALRHKFELTLACSSQYQRCISQPYLYIYFPNGQFVSP